MSSTKENTVDFQKEDDDTYYQKLNRRWYNKVFPRLQIANRK